jgi:hypothetical protein
MPPLGTSERDTTRSEADFLANEEVSTVRIPLHGHPDQARPILPVDVAHALLLVRPGDAAARLLVVGRGARRR